MKPIQSTERSARRRVESTPLGAGKRNGTKKRRRGMRPRNLGGPAGRRFPRRCLKSRFEKTWIPPADASNPGLKHDLFSNPRSVSLTPCPSSSPLRSSTTAPSWSSSTTTIHESPTTSSNGTSPPERILTFIFLRSRSTGISCKSVPPHIRVL